MISIEEAGKKIVLDLSVEYGASTIVRKSGEDQIRVEVASGHKRIAWYFSRYATNKSAALRDIDAEMRQALRKVGLSPGAGKVSQVIVEQARAVPTALAGPIGSKIREAITERVGKPAETEQPEVFFPNVQIPERKERRETRLLKERVAQLERDMANVKQITDQLR